MTKVFYITPRSTGISVTMGFLIALVCVTQVLPAPLVVRIFVLVIPVGILILFGFMLYSSRRTVFTISEEGLVVSRTMYGRHVPASALKADDAEILDLTQNTAYLYPMKTNGLGLPDYNLGWFLVADKEKVLMFVTDRRKTVHIPTRSGFSILLSTPNPEAFIQALQETIPRRGRIAEPSVPV